MVRAKATREDAGASGVITHVGNFIASMSPTGLGLGTIMVTARLRVRVRVRLRARLRARLRVRLRVRVRTRVRTIFERRSGDRNRVDGDCDFEKAPPDQLCSSA